MHFGRSRPPFAFPKCEDQKTSGSQNSVSDPDRFYKDGTNGQDHGSSAILVERLGPEQVDDRRTASPRGPMAVLSPSQRSDQTKPSESPLKGFELHLLRWPSRSPPVLCDSPRSFPRSRNLACRSFDTVIMTRISARYNFWSVQGPRTTNRLHTDNDWRAIPDSAGSSITGSYSVLPMARPRSRLPHPEKQKVERRSIEISRADAMRIMITGRLSRAA